MCQFLIYVDFPYRSEVMVLYDFMFFLKKVMECR